MLHYEDMVVGATHSFGQYEVTRAEVIDFASRYDPQPFHLDDAAAGQTHFGRLSASGWHTGAMTMRMLVDTMQTRAQASLGSPGIDTLRWLHPVYPGDTLRVETELLEKRRSKSRPEMGLLKTRSRTFNQDDVCVLDMVTNAMIRTRAIG
ncbi:MAG: MaoC family dehydratase [Parerythrobacter sp.]